MIRITYELHHVTQSARMYRLNFGSFDGIELASLIKWSGFLKSLDQNLFLDVSSGHLKVLDQTEIQLLNSVNPLGQKN